MIVGEVGDWLTAVRLDRLPIVLRAINRHPPPGVIYEMAPRVLWPLCGGPRNEIAQMLTILSNAGLIVTNDGRLRTTRRGRQLATQDHQSGGRLLARALIDAGFFLGQARRLSEIWSIDPESRSCVCQQKVAVGAAPQLVGLLRRFPGVTAQGEFRFPREIAELLSEVWALPEQGDDVRRAVGDRGEYYSYRYEQKLAADPSKIRWAAKDDDGLGYDIEDQNVVPHRRIEVKASRGPDVRFNLSVHEWDVAHIDPASYEVQYWGEVNMSRLLREEFEALTNAGYPIILDNFIDLVQSGALVAEVASYNVSRPRAVT